MVPATTEAIAMTQISDFSLLPNRQRLDRWLELIRWKYDLGNIAGLDESAVIHALPSHARVINPTTGNSISVWIEWSSGSVIAVPTDSTKPVTVEWQIHLNRSVAHRGTAQLTGSLLADARVEGLPEGTVSSTFLATTQRAKERHFHRLETAAASAEFEAVAALEPFVQHLVRRKNTRVAVELLYADEPPATPEGYPQPVVIDRIGEEEIVTELLWGEPERNSPAAAFRILRRAAQTGILQNVPIANYLRNQIASAAETAIRRKIGDPHLGRRIRRHLRECLAEERKSISIDELIDDWNAKNPKDRIGQWVAQQALTASNSTSSMGVHLSDEATLPDLTSPDPAPEPQPRRHGERRLLPEIGAKVPLDESNLR